MAGGPTYDLVIKSSAEWIQLEKRALDVIVDPFIHRLGHVFLEGERAAGPRADERRNAIASDLGGLVAFFDLIVLHERVPAFNYADTWDRGLDFDQQLGALVNVGDRVVLNVDVQYEPYMAAKDAAIEQLRGRMAEGPFVPEAVQRDILSSLAALEYEWEPGLGPLEAELETEDDKLLARFLVGVLTFGGYAQQSGAAHLLSPRRSRLMAEAGLGVSAAGPENEAEMYRELDRRFRGAGDGWRLQEIPWTPSFLPYLITQIDPYRDGPDVLLKQAMALREKKSITRYRELRSAAWSDREGSEDAREALRAAANEVAVELGTPRQDLEHGRHVMVEVLPRAVGVTTGAFAGTLVAGPVGTAVGGLAGLVGEEVLAPVQKRLWGWVIDRLTFRSARKMLVRAVRADYDTQGDIQGKMLEVWKTPRRDDRP